MIWIIVLVGLGFVLFQFTKDFNKDNDDLQGRSLEDKFNVIVYMLNDSAFGGDGIITSLSKRVFNLYKDGSNQIIKINYSTGHLTITWRFKYYQKEVVHEKQFDHVRNLSVFGQEKIAEQMINEMQIIVIKHKMAVDGEMK